MPAPLYETDYYLWARRQAKALRRLEQEHWNGPLDLKELAEEVDDLAKRDRNTCRSQVVPIVEHLLKLDHAPTALPQAGWRRSIFDAREELAADLTPTLRDDPAGEFPRLFAPGSPRRRVRHDRAWRGWACSGTSDRADRRPRTCPERRILRLQESAGSAGSTFARS